MRHARRLCLLAPLVFGAGVATIDTASARSCSDLRALCWTMRTDKSDCTGPYQRCLKTGVFVTPLGRVFKATAPKNGTLKPAR